MLLYFCIKPVGVEDAFAQALIADDPECLLKVSAPLVAAFKELREWAVNNGGTVFCEFGEIFVCSMPLDKIADFNQFIKKFQYTTKLCFAIGSGATHTEACMAMQVSELEGGERVVLYSDDIEASMKEAPAEDASLISKAEEFNLEFPNLEPDLNKDDQQAAPEPQAEQKESPKGDLKDKVVNVLNMVKEQAPVIAKLKEINPQAYEAVKQIVDVMIMLAQKGQPQEQPAPAQETPKEPEQAQPPAQEQPQQPPAAKSEDALPVGSVKDGRIKIEDKDPYTDALKGTHWHQVKAGMIRGVQGHAVGSTRPNAKTEE